MSNVDRVELMVQRAILAIVGVAAGAASFTHMHDWTMENSPEGTPDWFGWANACISELVPVAALLKIRQIRRTNGSITYPVCLLIGAATLSLAAQLAVAERSPAGWLLSAVPAVAFIALTKLVFSGSVLTEDLMAADNAVAIAERPEGIDEAPTAAPIGPVKDIKSSAPDTDLLPAVPPRPAVTRVHPRVLTSASKVQAAAASLPADATMAEIAAEAGVSESTVRRYRPNPIAIRSSPSGAPLENHS